MMVYSRKFLIAVCILQFVATLEWQVFNFLGYMWSPILACFIHIIFILVGFFGALQYRHKCAVVYILWLIIWVGLNVFVICIYLEIGILKKESSILNFGLGNRSWWFDHGLGCVVNASHPAYSAVRTPISALEQVEVTGCLLHYTHVEILHAGVQILLSCLGILAAVCLAYVLRNDEDTSQPVKSSELEFISMRHSASSKHGRHHPLQPSAGATPGVLSSSSSSRRLAATPPPQEFDTLVTQVDTLSPHHSRHASHESLQPMPPQRLSANRLLRDATLGSGRETTEEEEEEEEEDFEAGGGSGDADWEARYRDYRARKRQANRRSSGGGSKRHRRHAKQPRAQRQPSSNGPASSYLGADSSLDRRSAYSRDSSQRPREPLPWVVASPLLSDLGPPEQPQPPPYSSQPPSLLSGARMTSPPVAAARQPPSPAPYRPPRPAGAHSPYENWRPPPSAAGSGTYENAWSPVPPLQPMMTSPISAEDAASSHWSPAAVEASHWSPPPSSQQQQQPAASGSRGGVIFFRSNAGAAPSDAGSGAAAQSMSFGGSVVV